MSENNKPNYSTNIKYVLDCLNIKFTEKTYDAQKKRLRLDLGFSTFKVILSGKGPIKKSGKVVSEKTLQEIATAFSVLLIHPEDNRITAEALDMDPDVFASVFPRSAFVQNTKESLSVNMTIVTNKLDRGYYMMPNSPHKAYLAYFKLVERDGAYEAWLVRGIQDFSLAKDIRNNFDNFDKLEQCISQKNGGKETESIHLYRARNEVSRGHKREDIPTHSI